MTEARKEQPDKAGKIGLGKVLFYILWPLIWLYAPLVRRVRVYIKSGDEVLLVKNWFGPHVWQLPGGGIKFGESVLDAAHREIHEELGLTMSDSAVVTTPEVMVVRQFGLLMRYHVVLWELARKSDVQKSREIAVYTWANPQELVVAPEVLAAQKTV